MTRLHVSRSQARLHLTWPSRDKSSGSFDEINAVFITRPYARNSEVGHRVVARVAPELAVVDIVTYDPQRQPSRRRSRSPVLSNEVGSRSVDSLISAQQIASGVR